MLFGDGTHSKGDPNPMHLTFTQKSACGEDGKSAKFHTHQRPSCLKKEMMMLALPCYIQKNYEKKDDDKKEEGERRKTKKRKREKDIYKKEREIKEEREGAARWVLLF
jgi:hypothetical protein